MKLRIDHVTICGSRLAPLQQSFVNVSLTPDFGGPHANGLTHMALLGFEDGSYLELIAPLKSQGIERSPWAKLMLSDSGAGAWAVGASDIQAEVERLQPLGIEVSVPAAGSRNRPDGKVLEWETASLGPGSPGSMLPFMIKDHTPREWRVRPSASLQGSGLTGIAAIVLGVENLNRASELFQRAYAWDEPIIENHRDFGATVAYFLGTPVMLATPNNADAPSSEDSWLSSRLKKFGAIPAALLLQTADLAQAVERFHLSAATQWFDSQVAWFDSGKLANIKLGVVQP